MRPSILIFSGPNGAGKTTFAREFLTLEAGCTPFLNADLIAAGISPFQPEAAALPAGRVMLDLISGHVQRQESSAFETTLAGRSYARQIPQWRNVGYYVRLVFLALESPESAVARVAMRVSQGGHDIPEETIRRRFQAGLANFHGVYKSLVE